MYFSYDKPLRWGCPGRADDPLCLSSPFPAPSLAGSVGMSVLRCQQGRVASVCPGADDELPLPCGGKGRSSAPGGDAGSRSHRRTTWLKSHSRCSCQSAGLISTAACSCSLQEPQRLPPQNNTARHSSCHRSPLNQSPDVSCREGQL